MKCYLQRKKDTTVSAKNPVHNYFPVDRLCCLAQIPPQKTHMGCIFFCFVFFFMIRVAIVEWASRETWTRANNHIQIATVSMCHAICSLKLLTPLPSDPVDSKRWNTWFSHNKRPLNLHDCSNPGDKTVCSHFRFNPSTPQTPPVDE